MTWSHRMQVCDRRQGESGACSDAPGTDCGDNGGVNHLEHHLGLHSRASAAPSLLPAFGRGAADDGRTVRRGDEAAALLDPGSSQTQLSPTPLPAAQTPVRCRVPTTRRTAATTWLGASKCGECPQSSITVTAAFGKTCSHVLGVAPESASHRACRAAPRPPDRSTDHWRAGPIAPDCAGSRPP